MSRSSSSQQHETELIEQNRNLSLKLRYLQSVNTIFRQRVGVLMQALTEKIVELQVNSSAPVDLKALYAAADNTARSQTLGSGANPEVEYWQTRFLDAMSSVQPISQHEVETLCRLIRDKVDRNNLVSGGFGGVAAATTTTSSSAMAASGSPSSFPAAAAAAAAAASSCSHSPGSATYAASVAAEVLALREKLEQSEARCKSLYHRQTEMRKRDDREQQERSDQNVQLTCEVGALTTATREMKARLTEQEALNRRLTAEINVLRSDKNLQLQHLSRMQGMCAAVMRESQCAVNEGLAATQMNETALLKRQADTMELVLRKTELELNKTKRDCEDKDTALAEKERELHSLQLRMDSKEKTLELYRSRCEALATAEKDQREEQAKAMQSLSVRLTEAVGDLSGAFTTKNIVSGLDALNTRTERMQTELGASAQELDKKFHAMRTSYVALVEEVTLSAKEHRAPRVDALQKDEARVQLGDLKFPREAVLRTSGSWSEVRDLNTGSVFYTTTDMAATPFDPIAPVAVAVAAPPSPLSTALGRPAASPKQSPSRSAAASVAAAAAAAAASSALAGEPQPIAPIPAAELSPKSASPSEESAASAAAGADKKEEDALTTASEAEAAERPGSPAPADDNRGDTSPTEEQESSD